MKNDLKIMLQKLRFSMKQNFNRHVSIQDLLSDRWETAKFYGFGEGDILLQQCFNFRKC